jgi:hypothetical protein
MKRILIGLSLSTCALVSAVAIAQDAQTSAPPTDAAKLQVTVQTERPKLTWAPPKLENPTTVEISNQNRDVKLDQTKDYIIKMPPTPLEQGVRIWGGRNIVLIGGEIRIPSLQEKPDFKGERRALYLNRQTGTAHVEGLLIAGNGLQEGINLDQREGATVQLQNVRVERVIGTREGHHADVLQTWAGPAELHIDRLTGYTTYQGFFLLPNQHFNGPKPRLFDFRNMNLVADDRSGYMLWFPTPAGFPAIMSEVWVSPNPKRMTSRDEYLWPKPSTGDTAWRDVKVGTPPGGDFVPAGVAGLNYVSPGYIWEKSAP